MIRAIVLKIYPTAKKQRKIDDIIVEYRRTVNLFLSLNTDLQLDKKTLDTVTCRLSARYKSNALKQAIGIQKACKKTKKKTPKFNGYPILDKKFIDIEDGHKSFDLVFRLSTLSRGNRIILPSKKTSILNKWKSKGTLIQGGELHANKIIVWVDVPVDHKPKQDKILAIDLGIKKLITTSDGEFFGKDFDQILEKIRRKEQGSKAYKKTLKQRDQYINHVINQLPWNEISVLGYEDLRYLKHGKSNRNQKFRNWLQHWTY